MFLQTTDISVTKFAFGSDSTCYPQRTCTSGGLTTGDPDKARIALGHCLISHPNRNEHRSFLQLGQARHQSLSNSIREFAW